MFKISLTVLIVCLFLSSCKQQEPKRAFYYWKTTYRLSSFEEQYLKDLKIEKLYMRFFDVAWDEPAQKAGPLAEIQFSQPAGTSREIVPVIYIVNKALLKTENVEELAANIFREAEHVASKNNITFHELQIDCDWTETSKDKYFILLKFLKTALKKQHKQLSATIRLHQVKYKNITGVPDVDRGMLMYYNMGKISADSTTNSIFSPADAEKYIANLSTYPLPMDVALPAFSWGIHIRNGRVIELLNNLNASHFQDRANFQKTGRHMLSATHSFFYKGFYFMKNDVVKIEEVSPEMCQAAADQLQSKLPENIGTVAIYHTDSLIFKQYEKQDFEKVFNTVH